MATLKEALKQAILDEDYEKAARLRDDIRRAEDEYRTREIGSLFPGTRKVVVSEGGEMHTSFIKEHLVAKTRSKAMLSSDSEFNDMLEGAWNYIMIAFLQVLKGKYDHDFTEKEVLDRIGRTMDYREMSLTLSYRNEKQLIIRRDRNDLLIEKIGAKAK